MDDLGPMPARVQAFSDSDVLGYRGQHAVSQAVEGADGYLIVGGHMVRLLQAVYPTPRAVPRSTIDADTALEDVEVVGAVTRSLIDADFTKIGGNLLTKDVGDEKYVEVNLLLVRTGGKTGLDTRMVEGIGQIDTLWRVASVGTDSPRTWYWCSVGVVLAPSVCSGPAPVVLAATPSSRRRRGLARGGACACRSGRG